VSYRYSSRPVLSGNRVGHFADTADTGFLADDAGAVSLSEEDVSRLSPASTPGVTDNPVGSRGGIVVAFESDGVIELSATSGGEDTGGVGLEGHLVGLDGNGHGGGLKGVLHLSHDGCGVSCVCNGRIGGDLGNTLAGGVFASLVLGSVGVVGVGLLSVSLQVVPGPVVPATTATIATIASSFSSAVNELLGG